MTGERDSQGLEEPRKGPPPPESDGDWPELADADAYSLPAESVRAILRAIDAGDVRTLGAELEQFHPADVADLIEQLGEGMRRDLLRLWGQEIDGEILSELDEAVRREVIAALPPEVLGEAVRDLDSDDIVDLVEDLPDKDRDRILAALPRVLKTGVVQALSYPEYSAGRLMQREVVRAPEHWSVGDAIDALRAAEDQHLPEQFYHVILVDPKMHPVGYVTLSRILSSPRRTRLRDITEPSFRTVPVDQYEGDVAYAFNQYHLITLPVVDTQNRLVGAITIDDAMAVLDEENEEDILRLAGVDEESRISDRVMDTVKRRFPWLAANLGTAILASVVIGLFDEALAQIVALAILMPIVASMGGNAGTQSLTVAVRAIATKDLTGANIWRVVSREALAGLANGVAFAVIMGVVATIWFSDPTLGLVIAAAMVVNLAVAALAGILIPVALDRAGVDPALASGTFVTTVTDVVGFVVFLGLGVLVLL
ncbi:MAG: magnesium transporter [Paracoccaceae bacterium]|jgi:magnesium transporter|nr:magnesium transporter [Paracoccaceae bacterium]